jgi:hypothetical protein
MNKTAGDIVIVLDIKRRGKKMLWMLNIYDQSAREGGERLARRLSWKRIIKQGRGGTVFVGHFNAHSQRRDQRCTERMNSA